jgi:hypothetical protein
LLLLAALAVPLFACSDDGDDADIPDTGALEDDEIDLGAMALELTDIPDGEGFDMVGEGTFGNEEAAALAEDPEREELRLEEFGRIEAFQRAFLRISPELHLAKILTYTSQATLYEDPNSASRALAEALDFPTPGLTTEEFDVRGLGEEALGLLVTTDSEIGVRTDVAILFRVGRVIGSVVAQGLEGSERPEQTVALACRLEDRIGIALLDGDIGEDLGIATAGPALAPGLRAGACD